MTRENDKMCRIPYEVDKDSLRECGIAGISMKDIHEITIGSRRVNVIFVEGNKEQYDGKCLVSGWILSTPFPFYNCS